MRSAFLFALAVSVRSKQLVVVALTVAAIAAPVSAAAVSAPTAAARNASVAKTCSPGFVHAYLSWGEKCLRAGEFCKVGNPEYHRYGFTCPATGHLTYYTGRSARPRRSSHPAGATAKCRDGSYSYSAHRSGTCSHHGGVAVWYP